MKTDVWHLEGLTARLNSNNLQAQVTINNPFEGVSNIQFRSEGISETEILKIEFDSSRNEQSIHLVDYFIRGNDLVAVYDLLFEEGLSLQAYWRYLSESQSPTQSASVELILSLQSITEKRVPSLHVSSNCIAEQQLKLIDENSADFKSLSLSRYEPITWNSETGTSLALMHLAGTEASYAQMVHPSDFISVEVKRQKGNEKSLNIRHQLFGESLEKGVIRCVRILGHFLPRENDLVHSTECYKQLTAESPPLTA